MDATYELPVVYKVTKASASDTRGGHALLEQMGREAAEDFTDNRNLDRRQRL